VKRNDTPGPGLTTFSQSIIRTGQHRRSQYQKVRDERKRPIRGLWDRNGRFYAQLTIEDHETGRKRVRRVPLEGATTAAQAKAQLEEIKVGRRKGELSVLKRAPHFTQYADEYLEYHRVGGGKRASTLETEGYALDRLKEHLGHLRLDKIKRIHIDSYIKKRKAAGLSARTVNLEVTVFRNVMNRAIDAKWITSLPTENLRPLKSQREKRPLYTSEQIERLCSIGMKPIFHGGATGQASQQGQPLQNAQQFSDYIRLMCYCGARLSESLRLRWADVDWQKRQLIIGSDGQAKNGQWRAVDFNVQLESLLKEMRGRCAPDSKWIFPSPRRGEEDRPAKSFSRLLKSDGFFEHLFDSGV
jgi:integrase